MKYIKAEKNNVDLFMKIRLEMLRVVNNLPSEYVFDDELIKNSRDYFQKGNQTTILAVENDVVGCAVICYIDTLPTFSHKTGKRAHLMNVYTKSDYRRQGIATKMVSMLIDEAKEKGVTEISLDATESGICLYEKLGFKKSNECMTLNL